jgi:hypothetical protein
MSDSDVDGGPEPVAPAVRRQRRGAYQVSSVGRYRIFLIISSAIGLWASYFDHFPDLYGTEYEYVVGFALARWELRPSTDPPPNTDHEFMQGIASGLSENVRGFIQYPVLEVAKLSIQHAVQSHVDYSSNVVELDLLLRVLSDFAINLPDGSVYSVRGTGASKSLAALASTFGCCFGEVSSAICIESCEFRVVASAHRKYLFQIVSFRIIGADGTRESEVVELA